MRIRYRTVFLLIGTFITVQIGINGCIETIDFETDRTRDRLVVNGHIDDGAGPHYLELGKTTSEGSATEPVTGAQIIINDDEGNSEAYVERGDGRYALQGRIINPQAGGTYYIEIILNDGRRYRSRPETMPEQTGEFKDLEYELDTQQQFNEAGNPVEEDVIKILADTDIPDTESPLYLRWNVEEIYSFKEFIIPDPLAPPAKLCFVTQFSKPQQVLLYNSTESDAREISDQLLTTSVVNHTFYRRHYFNAVLYSTTRSSYEYWNQVDQVVNSNGTIFDVPPATPAGNVFNIDDESELVLGYFEASLTDTLRFYTQRFDFEKFIPNPCGRRQDTFGRPTCLNCLDLPSSTLEQPYYWLDDNRASQNSD